MLAASRRASCWEEAPAAAEEAETEEVEEEKEAASAAAQRARLLRSECLTSARSDLDKITETASAEAPPAPEEEEEAEGSAAAEEEEEEEEEATEAASASSRASRQDPRSPASNLPVTADLLASSAALAAAAWAVGKAPERDRTERSLRAWSAKRERSQRR